MEGSASFLPRRVPTEKEFEMNKDRAEGAAKQVKGAIKEAAGKVTGDAKWRIEGKAEKAEGEVQNAIGGLKDKAKEAHEEAKEETR